MTTALDGDWTAEKAMGLEVRLLMALDRPLIKLDRETMRNAALALQQQRLMLAAANARIAELEAAR